MAQVYQPKDYVFAGSPAGIALSGLDVTDENLSLFTDYSITGELLEVSWKFNRAGSLYLTESGTGRELFRRNAPSGAAGWQYAYPRVWGQDLIVGSVAVALGSNASFSAAPTQFTMALAAPLILNVSGAASGTQPLSFMFRYR